MDRNYKNQSQTDEESLNSEPTVQPGTVADEDIPAHGDEGDTYGPNELTGWTGCDADSPSGELSEIIDRPVTESVTARSGIDTDFPSSEHSELVSRPVTTDGPVSLGDTPPSSDSGIHSLEEQWENMSISAVDMESEQNGRPTNGSPTGRRGSDTQVPPNTEEEEDINCPWMDCLLEGESDELSLIDIPNYRKDIQYHCVTICKEENSSVNSGTDGGNSDTGVLADFQMMRRMHNIRQKCWKRFVVLMRWGFEQMRIHPSGNRHSNRRWMPMRISPRVGIRKIIGIPEAGRK